MTGDFLTQTGLTGTFINRNHFAGFMAMTIAVGFGLLVSWLDHQSTRAKPSFFERLEEAFQTVGTRKGAVAILLVAMLLALFLSRSRTGTAVIMVSLFLVTLMTKMRQHRSNREQRLLLPLLLVSLVAGAWFGLGHLTGRFMGTHMESIDRWQIFLSTFGLIRDYPFFGVGAGCFSVIFPMYRGDTLSGEFYDHAHNDHLEIFAEQGLLGYFLLAFAMILAWSLMARFFIQRQDPLARGMLLAGLAGTLALGLHGILDFNFQIPCNALYFMVILAAGLQGVTLSPPGKAQIQRKRRQRV